MFSRKEKKWPLLEIQDIKIMLLTVIIGGLSMLIQENGFTKPDIKGHALKKVRIHIMPTKYFGVD